MISMKHSIVSRHKLITTLMLLCLMMASSIASAAAPTFSKIFSPDTIGPGNVATLTFTISNNVEIVPATTLSFTDNLPANVTIATPANASSSCANIVLSAPNGGTVISLTDGSVGNLSSCTVSVDVTSSVLGTHTNTSGDLTSSAGNSGTSTDDLMVVDTLPGFSKSFSPATINFGGRSTMTFLIDNTANAAAVPNLDFTDNLPAGMLIASPANASTDCGTMVLPPTLTATAGSGVIILDANGTGAFPAVAAGATCSVSVDVTASNIGSLVNSTELLANFVTSGKSTGVLSVTADDLMFSKSFTDDPVAPGSTVNLQFTITNRKRSDTATSVAFSDVLDASLMGVTVTSVDTDDCSGIPDTGTAGTFNYSGGTVAAGSSCTITLSLTVPGGATEGAYPNTTSSITADLGGIGGTYSAATDTLFVQAVPVLTKNFTDDPVASGDPVTLEFTVTNPSATSGATNITFIDELTNSATPGLGFVLPFPISVGTLPTDPCGAGSTLTVMNINTDREGLLLNGGSLAQAGMAGDSCTFSVPVNIPTGFPGGVYTNTTGTVSATINAATATGNTATDNLTVIGAPRMTKNFTNDPVPPGGTVTLDITISHDATAPGDATNINFTDNLDGMLTGTTVNSVLSDNCNGTPAGVGTGTFGYSGGSLTPDTECTISLDVAVPMAATPGTYTNTTSGIVADILTITTTGNPAQDDLIVTGLTFTKEFTDDPALPGDLVNLRFTLDNTNSTVAATGIFFTDNLSSALSALASEGALPATPCGAGSSISGTTLLIFTGGNLAAGSSCVFDIPVRIPFGAANGDYNNITSSLAATIGGSGVVLPAATDTLTVSSTLLSLSKSFTDDPVIPGATVTLEFTINNLDMAQAASAIAFTDDLDTTLSGLTWTSSISNTCNGMATGVGTGTFSYSGGSLAAGASCVISITLQVPGGVAPGTTALNTTSSVTGTIDGLAVTGDPATDTLLIQTLSLSKAFGSSATPGETVALDFTLTNFDAINGANTLGFTDDLDAVISGLVATGLPVNDVCGAGSQLSGTSLLTVTGASLLPSGSCNINVTLQVPPTANPGTYTNTSSSLLAIGLPVAAPATATLTIDPPPLPTFSKSFSPTSVTLTAPSTLTFTIDNTVSFSAASGLDFTDNLPTNLLVANPASASTTCTGGTLAATSGTGVISYTGGTVSAAASCTIQVNVSSSTAATYNNVSGNLTSSAGNSGTAAASLTVNPPPAPGFSKSFSPSAIAFAGVSTLIFSIDNSGSPASATSLAFTDNLPAGVVVATPSNAATTCTGGTLTAVNGSSVVSYTGGTVADRTSCTVQTDVTSSVAGTYVNTSGDLTSSAGNSGTATANLVVSAIITTLDDDGDGVLNTVDLCPATTIPETPPAISQYAGYYTLFNADPTFDTVTDVWLPTPPATYTLNDTAGCSCEQIIAAEGLGQFFTNYGCPTNVMDDWISKVP